MSADWLREARSCSRKLLAKIRHAHRRDYSTIQRRVGAMKSGIGFFVLSLDSSCSELSHLLVGCIGHFRKRIQLAASPGFVPGPPVSETGALLIMQRGKWSPEKVLPPRFLGVGQT
jgi:hypothetical protein